MHAPNTLLLAENPVVFRNSYHANRMVTFSQGGLPSIGNLFDFHEFIFSTNLQEVNTP
jgi:hypothetical protein